MAAIAVAPLAQNGETMVWPYNGGSVPTVGGALTNAYVGGLMFPVRTAKYVDVSVYLLTGTGTATVYVKPQMAFAATPDDTASNWFDFPDEVDTSGAITRNSKIWQQATSAAAVTYGFQFPAMGNWCRLWAKADANAASSVLLISVILRAF